MWLQIIGTIAASVLAGIAYRYGGSSNGIRWVREVTAAIALMLVFIVWNHWHWTVILCAGALYGLETTYFKKKGTDAKWWNWLLVGLAFSVAVLPVVLVQHLFIGFIIRTLVCTFLVVYWSESNGNVVCEEFGRGVIPIVTLPLLFIGA